MCKDFPHIEHYACAFHLSRESKLMGFKQIIKIKRVASISYKQKFSFLHCFVRTFIYELITYFTLSSVTLQLWKFFKAELTYIFNACKNTNKTTKNISISYLSSEIKLIPIHPGLLMLRSFKIENVFLSHSVQWAFPWP